jgi:hypothetical protein
MTDHTVNEVLGTIADYGQVIKIYGKNNPDEIRYSAAECIGMREKSFAAILIKIKLRLLMSSVKT